MYIPKEFIIFMCGYFFCPITAYIWMKYKDHRENKRGHDN